MRIVHCRWPRRPGSSSTRSPTSWQPCFAAVGFAHRHRMADRWRSRWRWPRVRLSVCSACSAVAWVRRRIGRGSQTSTGSSGSFALAHPRACCWCCRDSSPWRPVEWQDGLNCPRPCSVCRRGRSHLSRARARLGSQTWGLLAQKFVLSHFFRSPRSI